MRLNLSKKKLYETKTGEVIKLCNISLGLLRYHLHKDLIGISSESLEELIQKTCVMGDIVGEITPEEHPEYFL